MHRNGQPLRVLLSGPAANELAPSLEDQETLSMVLAGDPSRTGLNSSVDVTLHVVASSSAELGEDIRAVRALSEAPLILAAYGEPNGIVEAGLEIGAADVIVLPQPMETLLFALQKAARANGDAPDSGTVVTVFSPKGGSGKTVLATNIALAARRSGIPTLLVDLDLQFGDAALALAIAPRATIADLASSSGETDVEKLKAFVCTDARSMLDLLPAPKRPEEAQVVGQAGARGRPRRGSKGLRRRRHRHRAAFRRCNVGRARPHRSPRAGLQSRGDVAQERSHRPGDDRPARIPARACFHRGEPDRRSRRRIAQRDRGSSRGRDRLRASRRPGSTDGGQSGDAGRARRSLQSICPCGLGVDEVAFR